MQMSKLESTCCEVMHIMSLPSRKEIMQEMTKLLLDYVGGTVSGFLSLGGRTSFYLSSLWDDVPIVKNISIDGRVEMLIKYRGKVDMGGRWNISGVYRPMSWLSLSLGYTSDADLGNMVSLSLGVLL